jgi:hypothetical protein
MMLASLWLKYAAGSVYGELMRSDFIGASFILMSTLLSLYTFDACFKRRAEILRLVMTLSVQEDDLLTRGEACSEAVGGTTGRCIASMRSAHIIHSTADAVAMRDGYETNVAVPLTRRMRAIGSEAWTAEGEAERTALRTMLETVRHLQTAQLSSVYTVLQVHMFVVYTCLFIILPARWAPTFGYWALVPTLSWSFITLGLTLVAYRIQNPFADVRRGGPDENPDAAYFDADAFVFVQNTGAGRNGADDVEAAVGDSDSDTSAASSTPLRRRRRGGGNSSFNTGWVNNPGRTTKVG